MGQAAFTQAPRASLKVAITASRAGADKTLSIGDSLILWRCLGQHGWRPPGAQFLVDDQGDQARQRIDKKE